MKCSCLAITRNPEAVLGSAGVLTGAVQDLSEYSFFITKDFFIISGSYCPCSTVSVSMHKVLLLSNELCALEYFFKLK